MAKELTPEQIAEDIINDIESELLSEDSKSVQDGNTASTRSDAEKAEQETADGDASGEEAAAGDSESKLKANVAKKQASAEKKDALNEADMKLSDEEQAKYDAMSKEDQAAYMKAHYAKTMKEEDEEGDEEDPESTSDDSDMIKKKVEESLSSDEMATAISEHVDKLIDSQSDLLSEEQKGETALIFEAAVRDRTKAATDIIVEEVETILEARTTQIEESFEAKYDTLVDQVDGYLAYAVKEWMTENEIAIESGLRSELTEEFMSGLKDLFLENYIDMPEEKYDVLAEQDQEISDLRGRLDEEIGKNVTMAQDLVESTRVSMVEELSSNLTETEKERLSTMLEGVDSSDTDAFKSKVSTLIESFFVETPSDETSETAIPLNEEVDDAAKAPQKGSLIDQMSQFTDTH